MRLRLKEWRERRFLSLSELAERAGLTKATVVRIEQGQRSPHPRTIRKLAEALGVQPEELLDHD